MGKVKQKKYSFHSSLRKANNPRILSNVYQVTVNAVAEKKSVKFEVNSTPKSNIFQNVVISPNDLQLVAEEYLKQSKNNVKFSKCDFSKLKKDGYKIRKKQQRRRKIPFIEVIQSANDFLRKREQQKKEEKAAILGNFQSMKDALPTLEQLITENKIKNQEDRPRVSKSLSRQNAEMVQDIQTYRRILNSPGFASNPIAVISAHIQQQLKSGDL